MRCILLVTLLLSLTIQGSITAEATVAKPVVKADKSYYDADSGLYILNGNVYIEIRNQKFTAGQAKASLSTMEIWGSGGVTFSLDDIYLTADSVRVISLQNKALITGNVNFNRGDLNIKADTVELNWDKKVAMFYGNVRLTKGEALSADSLLYNYEANTWQ